MKALKLGLPFMVFVGATAIPPVTLAQEAQTPASTSEPAAQNSLQEIVVTGTRLKTGGFSAPTPVSVLDSERFAQTAPASIGDVVLQSPVLRQTTGATQGSARGFNVGVVLPDLRGLGAVRTLTLVDGQRFIGINGAGQNFGSFGTVDLNLVPLALVDRIEVVTGGASAAYGSDAVAGVVNVILKHRMDGIQGSMSYGQTKYHDGESVTATLAGGTSFAGDRAHVLFGADFANTDEAPVYNRPWARAEPGFITVTGTRAAGVPSRLFSLNALPATLTNGGLIAGARTAAGTNTTALNDYYFNPDGSLSRFNRGTTYGALMIGGSNPGLTQYGGLQVNANNRRYVGMARLGYDVSDSTELFASFNYGHNEGSPTSAGQSHSGIIVQRNNPYLPQSIATLMDQQNITQITVNRFDNEFNSPDPTIWTDIYRLVVGGNGQLSMLGSSWDWTAYAETQVNRSRQDIDRHFLNANYLAAAYAVRDTSGNIVCGPIATNPNLTAALRAIVQPGCVPMNVFGAGNAFSAVDYVTGTSVQKVESRQHVVSVDFSGSPFKMPAGDAQLAFGAEARRETVDSTADALTPLRAWQIYNAAIYTGEQTVGEGFVEVGLPLLRNQGVQSLDLNAAARETHYKTSGWVTTWKVGATSDITDWLRFRTTYSRDIRAATLYDLFNLGSLTSVNNFTNPFNGAVGTLRLQNKGNPDLKPEIANTFTIGTVLSPLRGLRFSADYFSIDIEDAIASLAGPTSLALCYQGQSQYCSSVVTDATPFGLSYVAVQPFNLNSFKVRGFDFDIAYQHDLGPGQLSVSGQASRIFHYRNIDFTGQVLERAGSITGGVPKFTWRTDLSYRVGPIEARLSGRGFGPVVYDSTLLDPTDQGYSAAATNSINDNHFGGATYLDLGLRYTARDADAGRLELFANVDNVMDRDPNGYVYAATFGSFNYDTLGRRYRAGLRFSF